MAMMVIFEWVSVNAARLAYSIFIGGFAVAAVPVGCSLIMSGRDGILKREWAPRGLTKKQLQAKGWPAGKQAVVAGVIAITLGAIGLAGAVCMAGVVVGIWLGKVSG